MGHSRGTGTRCRAAVVLLDSTPLVPNTLPRSPSGAMSGRWLRVPGSQHTGTLEQRGNCPCPNPPNRYPRNNHLLHWVSDVPGVGFMTSQARHGPPPRVRNQQRTPFRLARRGQVADRMLAA
jgi:hypothetical protein